MKNAFYIMNVMADAGYETRIVGGAVRDFVINQTPKDIDLATVALPEVTRDIFTKLGHTVVDTGLQHGTISIILDHIPYEITTLRIDTNQDGRHADVEFTTDWETDAARRDFTMNAMYMDRNCKIYDYFSGRQHIFVANNVMFVNDSRDRIKEDFLRILRYFRFSARYNFGMFAYDLDVIRENRYGLYNISKERIYSEVMKIVGYGNNKVLVEMNKTGVSEVIFSKELIIPEFFQGKPELSLFKMGIGSEWFLEYKAPNEVTKRIKFHETFVPGNFNYDLFVHGSDKMDEHCVLNNKTWGSNVHEAPKFPLTGNDFPHLKGKEIGDKLKELQKYWAENDFIPTREELFRIGT